MALTTEQQTCHLSRLQQEVLAWDYYRMGAEDDLGASGGRKLRKVPMTFSSITEYLDVFEPLVLEECAAQVCRGEEGEDGKRPANIGAVFRCERNNGFHVVQFILTEEAMKEFHDNDLILISKTDPTVELDDGGGDGSAKDAAPEKEAKKPEAALDAATAAAAAAAMVDGADADAPPPEGVEAEPGADAEADGEERVDDPEAMSRIYAFGYVDGRDSRNKMRIRLYLPENTAKVHVSNATKDAKKRGVIQQQQDDDHARFRAMRNALAAPKSAWYLMHLANMSTIAREWLALHAFPSLPFAHTILSGKSLPKAAHASWELPGPLNKALNSAYNESQMKALSAALEKQPITLIQGPPGTGKTRVILSLLSVILHAQPGAKSGVELDLKRYLEVRNKKALSPADIVNIHRRSAPWLRGVLNPRDAPPLPRQAPRPAAPPVEKPEVLGEDSVRRTKVLICAPSNAALDEIVLRILKTGVFGPNGSPYSPTLVRVGVKVHHSVEAVGMDALVASRMNGREEKSGMNKEKKFELALERDRVKLAILDEAAVVCSTLSFSGSGMFSRMTRQFDVVVIDEASQAVEPSTLVPLCYGAKQVFLVGDPQQLPATVLSSVATDHHYDQSLFKRFEQCGYPIHMLKTQYRMHPAIREFPSNQFYAGELEDGESQAEKTKKPWHKNALFRPFVFLDIDGKEYHGNGASWANDEEADVAVNLVATLMRTYPELATGEKIGVISPYAAQVKLITRKLQDALGSERAMTVDVNSIDGFQGREKSVCIFSVVRAPKHGGSIGFVKDERRMNVGLTRAKNSLIVLGSAKSLKSDKNWGELVNSAKKRGLIMKPPGKDHKAFVAKYCAAYNEDDLSGSEEEEADFGIDVETAKEKDGDAFENENGGFVYRANWSAGQDAEEAEAAAEAAAEGVSIAAAGFTAAGDDVELVTEAPTKGGGKDDYGDGGGENDDDPYAQEPEVAAGGKKRGRPGGGGGGVSKMARTR